MNFLKRPLPVLMYHRVNRNQDSSLTVSPETFAKQIHWLRQTRFKFLSLDQASDLSKTFIWDRSVSLTFDDGFLDNYENAFPLLIQHKIPAALFVVVNWVGQKDYVTWDQIRELNQSGISIGSHSLTHRWLPDIKDDVELQSEIADSKKKIEDETGREVRYFSYPVGGVDERVMKKVRDAGYRNAWVAGARPSIGLTDPDYCLRRFKVTPSDSSLSHFSVKAYGLKSLLW